MAGFSGLFSGLGGAVNDLFQGQQNSENDQLQAQSDYLQAKGDFVEATEYNLGSTLASQNQQYATSSMEVQTAAAARAIALSTGSTNAQVASAGFTNSGSALDILRSSHQQGALQMQLTKEQGQMTVAGYQEQSQVLNQMAGYASYAGNEMDLMGNQEEQMASQAASQGIFGAVLSGLGGIASMF